MIDFSCIFNHFLLSTAPLKLTALWIVCMSIFFSFFLSFGFSSSSSSFWISFNVYISILHRLKMEEENTSSKMREFSAVLFTFQRDFTSCRSKMTENIVCIACAIYTVCFFFSFHFSCSVFYCLQNVNFCVHVIIFDANWLCVWCANAKCYIATCLRLHLPLIFSASNKNELWNWTR